MIGLLTALPKTPLHARLKAEGRLRDLDSADNTKSATNVIPKRMSYEELVGGYQAMLRRLATDSAIAQRVINKLKVMPAPVYDGDYSLAQSLRIVARLLWRGVARGGLPRIWHFARSVPWTAPGKLSLFISEWIVALAMQDYVARHFQAERVAARHQGEVARRFEKLQRLVAESFNGAAVALSNAGSLPDISIRLPQGSMRSFVDCIGDHLDATLRATHSSLTLRIDALREGEREAVQRLLAHIATGRLQFVDHLAMGRLLEISVNILRHDRADAFDGVQLLFRGVHQIVDVAEFFRQQIGHRFTDVRDCQTGKEA